MKILFQILLLLCFVIKGYSQKTNIENDSTKSYNNNIKTGVLGVLGYFSLHYEHAFSPKFSVSFIGEYYNPFKQYGKNYNSAIEEQFRAYIQGRYYLDKNGIPNNGLYLSAALGYYYNISYPPGDKSTIYTKRVFPLTTTTGIGYQMLIKKRLVADIGFGFTFGWFGKYKSIPYGNGWEKPIYNYNNVPVFLSVGYAF